MSCCDVEGCERPRFRRQWCSPHYQRWQKHGSPTGGGRYRDGSVKSCSVPGCTQPWRTRDWCEPHYQRFMRYGDPTYESPTPERHCVIDGCLGRRVARGWCSSHYGKWRKTGDPTFVSTPQTRRKSTRRRLPEGYVVLYLPEHPNARKDGRIAEHTVVMAEKIGRPLLPGENVHHVNGVRDDNRPENLELWRSMQPSGQRVADLIAFAKQVLDEYGEDLTLYA